MAKDSFQNGQMLLSAKALFIRYFFKSIESAPETIERAKIRRAVLIL
jgi:hypothetical protein